MVKEERKPRVSVFLVAVSEAKFTGTKAGRSALHTSLHLQHPRPEIIIRFKGVSLVSNKLPSSSLASQDL